MELLSKLLILSERNVIDRNLAKPVLKALKPLGRGIKLISASQGSDGIEGEGSFEKKPNSGAIKKAEKALEEFGLDLVFTTGDFPGMTTGGADIEISRKDNTFTFFITFMQR